MNFFAKFIKKDVESAIPIAFDAEILRRKGKYKKALHLINQAINIDKNNPNYYMQRALILRSLKKFNSALEDINNSIKLNPTFNRNYIYRHLIHKDLNDMPSAEEDLKIAEGNTNNNNIDSLYEYLGYEALKKDNKKDAVMYFKKVLDYNPNNEKIEEELFELESYI